MNLFLIKTPRSWDLITKSLIQCSRNKSADVEYISKLEDISEDKNVISVHVMNLTGLANYAIEVYGKEILKLPDDTIGMHLALTLGQDVIISDNNLNPFSWMLLRPDGKIRCFDTRARTCRGRQSACGSM